MYIPDTFKEADPTLILRFLRENPFGTLIQSGDSEPVVTHIPFQISETNGEIVLSAHLSRNNPHSNLIRDGRTALVSFLGPHGYISSSVYGHPNVPTWNYQAVHIYGTVSIASNEEMKEHLRELVDHHETTSKDPLQMDRLPEELIASYMGEILAFSIMSYRIEAAFKLSQNRNDADFEAIIEDLSRDPNNAALISAMRASRK